MYQSQYRRKIISALSTSERFLSFSRIRGGEKRVLVIWLWPVSDKRARSLFESRQESDLLETAITDWKSCNRDQQVPTVNIGYDIYWPMPPPSVVEDQLIQVKESENDLKQEKNFFSCSTHLARRL